MGRPDGWTTMATRRPAGTARQRGSATVVALGVVLVLLVLGTGGLLLGSAVLASHRARSAADLAALAAADTLAERREPVAACAAAARVGKANGAVVRRCLVEADSVLVRVEVSGGARLPGAAIAEARAGPDSRRGAQGQLEPADSLVAEPP